MMATNDHDRSIATVIIDSRIHAYEADTPKRPRHTVPNGPPSASGEDARGDHALRPHRQGRWH